jgi:hypothetical protein
MGRVWRAVGRMRARIDAGERGAALVEAAILMPVVLLIVFGAIEFSSLYKDAATLSSSARAGGRVASAEPRVPSMAADAAAAVGTALSSLPASGPLEMWVYEANAAGYPGSGSGFSSCSGHCVSMTWNPATKSFDVPRSAADGSWWPAASQDVCPGTNSTWSRVGIYVHAKHAFVTNLFGASKTLSSHSVFRLEPVPSTQCS